MNIALLSIVPLRYFKEATTLTVLNLARELKAQGHTVVIITQKAEGLAEREMVEGIPVYRLHNKGKLLSHGFAVRDIQKSLGIKFDIIHSFSSTPLFALSGQFAKLFSPKAKVVHSMKSYSRRKSDSLLFPLLNISRKVTVPTREFKLKLRGVAGKKISIVYSPINTKKFSAVNAESKEALKQKHGFTGKKVVLYYGSFHEHKGADNLLRAIPDVVGSLDDTVFVFAPRYSHIPKERALVRQMGVEKNVQFYVNDIPIQEFVNLADVVVLPYNSMIATDGNPSCILEAMACKTPVITANLPELREMFAGDVVLTNVKDAKNLAYKITRVLERRDTVMVERAYKKAQQFSGKNVAQTVLQLYKK